MAGELEHRKLEEWQCQILRTRGPRTSRSPLTFAQRSKAVGCVPGTGCRPRENMRAATELRSVRIAKRSPCCGRKGFLATYKRHGTVVLVPPEKPQSPEYIELSQRLDRIEANCCRAGAAHGAVRTGPGRGRLNPWAAGTVSLLSR